MERNWAWRRFRIRSLGRGHCRRSHSGCGGSDGSSRIGSLGWCGDCCHSCKLAFVAGIDHPGSSLIMGSLFGAGGAGLVGYKVAHKTDEVSEFDFVPLGGKGLSVRIVVPGFIDQDCPLAVLTVGSWILFFWLSKEKKMKERTDETDSGLLMLC